MEPHFPTQFRKKHKITEPQAIAIRRGLCGGEPPKWHQTSIPVRKPSQVRKGRSLTPDEIAAYAASKGWPIN